MKRFIILCLLFAAVSPVAAFQIQYGRTVTITQPVFEDLYVTGGTVIVNAPIHGDLIVAGGTITVNDTVISDILVAGGRVTFNGYVGDDIRCLGGDLHILRSVAGDVAITGGTLSIDKDVSIGNLIATVGELTIDGTVAGSVQSLSGNLVLNGIVSKNMNCKGGKIVINGKVYGQSVLASNDRIVIGDAAVFGGNVRYWIPGKKVDFKQSLQAGHAIHDPSLKMSYDRWYFLGFSSILGLLWYVGTALLLIIILQYVFAPVLIKAAETLYTSKWRALGYGLLFWTGVPVAAALAFITLIGVPVGLLLLVSYFILLALAIVITSSVAANWFNHLSNGDWSFWQLVFAAFAIFVVLKVLSLTPFFGWLILALLICMAFGAVVLNINWRKKQLVSDNKRLLPITKEIIS